MGEFIRLKINKGHFFEPCSSYKMLEARFGILKENYITDGYDYTAYNYGLSDRSEIATMRATLFNGGQSNSLLRPKKHLTYFPEINFNLREQVYIKTLDSFKINDCNFLMMDVQGYELQVLKGATETLKHIDYIYTEVNREELYENCAMVEDLDNYLTDFRRVETKWKRKGFGDALFIRSTLLK